MGGLPAGVRRDGGMFAVGAVRTRMALVGAALTLLRGQAGGRAGCWQRAAQVVCMW
jgi:hypothetical protein